MTKEEFYHVWSTGAVMLWLWTLVKLAATRLTWLRRLSPGSDTFSSKTYNVEFKRFAKKKNI